MSGYSDRILAETGLVSYWRLGEASGNALDSGTGGNPLTPSASGLTRGAASLLVSDPDDLAVVSNGSTGFLKHASNSNFDFLTDYTVEGWVRIDATTGNEQNVVAHFNGTSTGGYEMVITNTLQLRANHRGAGTVTSVITNTNTIALGVPFHYVTTYKKSTTTMAVYLNGTLPSTTPTGNSGGNPRSDADDVATAITAILTVSGRSGDGVADPTGNLVSGAIDEVAIYNVALTQAQVQAHYADGVAVILGAPVPSRPEDSPPRHFGPF